MMTVSAVCRLMPRPPARVDKRKTNFSELGALYLRRRRELASSSRVVEWRRSRSSRSTSVGGIVAGVELESGTAAAAAPSGSSTAAAAAAVVAAQQ